MGRVDGLICPACGTALRVCPVCSAVVAVRPGRGRPRVYCGDECRWKAGHAAARQRARAREQAPDWPAGPTTWPGGWPTWPRPGYRAPPGLRRQNRVVPEPAERKALARAAARRREAEGVLRITEATARYGASQMANGLGPADARAVAVEVAAELAMAAEALRRLARLGRAAAGAGRRLVGRRGSTAADCYPARGQRAGGVGLPAAGLRSPGEPGPLRWGLWSRRHLTRG